MDEWLNWRVGLWAIFAYGAVATLVRMMLAQRKAALEGVSRQIFEQRRHLKGDRKASEESDPSAEQASRRAA